MSSTSTKTVIEAALCVFAVDNTHTSSVASLLLAHLDSNSSVRGTLHAFPNLELLLHMLSRIIEIPELCLDLIASNERLLRSLYPGATTRIPDSPEAEIEQPRQQSAKSIAKEFDERIAKVEADGSRFPSQDGVC